MGHPLDSAIWHKSSYSGSNGGNCVEVAGNLARGAGFPATFKAFTAAIKSGELGLS